MISPNLLTGDHGARSITSLGPQFVARRPDEADGSWRGWAGGRDVQPPRIPVSRGLASSPLAQQLQVWRVQFYLVESFLKKMVTR